MSLVSMPSAPAGTLAQQVQQQYAYLFQLAQTLNLSLQALEGSGGAAVQARQVAAEAARQGREERAQQAANLKSLIIKTADTVRQEMDRRWTELSGTYVAQSEFGTYLEKTSQEIEEDPTVL